MIKKKLLALILNHKIETLLFLGLLSYVIIRAFTVFYIHDELVTKYGYMIDWNPLPFTGYIDANNHFLLSLFGGLFYRIFQSDHIFVIRLTSVLAFPLYFFSLVNFKPYFKSRIAYFTFLVLLTCNQFILEYFSLCRGYGLAWAFLLFSVVSVFKFQTSSEKKHLLQAVFSLLASIAANLSVLPICAIIMIHLGIVVIQNKQFKWLTWLSLSLIPIGFSVYYSFYLKSLGKLYLGNANDFIGTTLVPVFRFGFYDSFIDSIFTGSFFLLLLFAATIKIYTNRKKSITASIFPIYLILFTLSIFAQNFILGVNFPEDRAAMPLLFLILGTIAFLIDHLKISKLGYLFMVLSFVSLGSKVNLNHTETWAYEHFDSELLSKIPVKTDGIPSSTGGRFWQIDNELSKTYNYPARVFQNAILPSDTLMDYIIQMEELRPGILKTYSILHKDSISDLCLFERKVKLKRTKIKEKSVSISGDNRFFNLLPSTPSVPSFIRCSGTMLNTNLEEDYLIVFSAENPTTGEKFEYGGINPVNTCFMSNEKSISFDFTYTMKEFPAGTEIKCYLYNNKRFNLIGEIKTSLYSIKL